MKTLISILILAATLTGCSSSTKGGAVKADRSQFLLVPNSMVVSSSLQAYEQTKAEAQKKGTLDKNPSQVARVQNIMKKLLPHVSVFRSSATGWAWESHVITSDEINAYCMPGGKIMFYSGIIDKLGLTDAEIAAIMGHEIAHALREHGRERMSQAIVQQAGLMALVISGKVSEQQAGALAAAATVAVALPHGRGQESEADDIGVELMARAGYDPREAISLWQKMGKASAGKKPPEFLSTHPSDTTRIKRIEKLIPKTLPLYQAAAK